MKYIGKQYVAIDNSYELNLSNPKAQKKYLAGTHNSDFTVTTIKSEPMTIKYLGEHSKDYKPNVFVIVEDESGYTYITLFYEQGLIDTNNTIEDHEKRHNEFQLNCLMDH